MVEANHHEVVVVDQRQPCAAAARLLAADRQVDALVVTDKVGVRDIGRRCVVARTLGVDLHPDVDRVADTAVEPVAVIGCHRRTQVGRGRVVPAVLSPRPLPVGQLRRGGITLLEPHLDGKVVGGQHELHGALFFR